jgi:Domain of unknown function (DUF4252)
MNRLTRTLTRTFVGLLLCCIPLHGLAQDARLQLGNLDKLSAKAVRVTDVTLDGPLLELATKIIEKADDNDPDTKQLKDILKNLKGIYVKSFEFDEASQYSKEDVEAIRAQLTSPHWMKLVQSIDKRNNEHDEIYLLKVGEHIGGLVILVAEARELSIVNIVGEVPVDKIAALEHHFVPNANESGKDKPKNKQQKKESSHDEEEE